ncbi:hypothetical protein Asppvi_003880 [Aspergillus pseudoviridinutans]|uniref:Uncharacterized protein n=1 Tax=Aspergillus pseudoviridinutans TaxID=1517512 RepID=A0A9P3B6R1_9EURO|nr:uncharacterized protein Asppvi_003880 [Aspergillus pseudoviridinutans]GIJ85025.1 hypothetical protein Asppvi_003880 [Aspergillus pseudoviridinutans]
MGDSWRTLQDSSSTDDNESTIETSFDLSMKIKCDLNVTIKFEIPSRQCSTAFEEEPPAPKEGLHHYRIFPDYGTDFLWFNVADPSYDPPDTYVDSSEVLSRMHPSVAQGYDSWVRAYNDNFKARCEDTQDYSANVFGTPSEYVAWLVTGYLLAWRIALDPRVGSVEYLPGRTPHVLERGTETAATVAFLEEQAMLLANPMSHS